MKCPVDQTTLQMTERKGIEIDYCPNCRGVWLDRGELDKLIDTTTPQTQPIHDDYEARQSFRHADSQPYGYKKKRKESFLGDLFDF